MVPRFMLNRVVTGLSACLFVATSRYSNERNRIIGLHPTWIVTDREHYRQQLCAARSASHDDADRIKGIPLWTYFNVAEAQQ